MKSVAVDAVFVETKFSADSKPTFFHRMSRALTNPVLAYHKLRVSQLTKRVNQLSNDITIEGFGAEGKSLNGTERTSVIVTDGPKDLNSEKNVEKIRSFDPNLIVCCGCSILKEDIIAIPELGVINLHGGISQKYRGILPIIFAINNNEPEYIGLTVHYVTPGIDDGEILYQDRPEIAVSDTPEHIYVKIVKLGIEKVLKAIEDIREGKESSKPLTQAGELYLAKMATPEVILKAWKDCRPVLESYLANKEPRDTAVRELLNDSA